MKGELIVLCFAMACCSSPLEECSAVIASHYPRQYITYKANSTPAFDGNLDEPFWNAVPWTQEYVDISTQTRPKFVTKSKVRWDDKWVYVGGLIEDNAVWANISYTCHCFNNSEDQVIFHDNDFEVFFDVDGTCHYYKEYEMNAANQNWDLLLNAPYENGGYENSTRVFGPQGFDMQPPMHCATFIDGVLNEPKSQPSFWSVEIAFPIEKLVFHTTLAGTTPRNKQFWRINFSRVEWGVKIVNGRYEKFPSCQSCPQPGSPTCDNWVWSPMYAIDVHHPELWGFLQFSTDEVNTTQFIYNEEWPPRYVAHELYYAMVGYYSEYGKYTSDLHSIIPFANHNVTLNELCTGQITIWANNALQSYVALIPSSNTSLAITITQDRFIQAHYFNSSFTLENMKENLERLARH